MLQRSSYVLNPNMKSASGFGTPSTLIPVNVLA
jgi:hypothetical protein